MSDFSLTLVLHFKTSKNFNGMAKVQIKSEKITPFGGIFHVREQFSRFVGPVIETKENQQHQSLRIQVHQRARKVDKDCKAISTEYLKFPTPTEVAVVGIDSFFFFNFLFSLRSRKLLP